MLEAIVTVGDVARACDVGHALVDALVGGPAAPMVDVHLSLARAQLKTDTGQAASETAAARALATGDSFLLARVDAVDALVTLETDRADRLPTSEALARRATATAEAAGLFDVACEAIEVMCLVAARLSNREIADRLYLSARTVEKHVGALLSKLDADSRVELGSRAFANGWVLPMFPST